jgi:hypothetical protein
MIKKNCIATVQQCKNFSAALLLWRGVRKDEVSVYVIPCQTDFKYSIDPNVLDALTGADDSKCGKSFPLKQC